MAAVPPVEPAAAGREHVRVAVVGSGFAGVGASVALAQEGIAHVVLERRDGVGGTWRDNRYPGCRCDVPSHLYSLSFAPNPDWRETYSRQPEILAYLQGVAEEHGVIDRTRFGQELLDASWDGGAQRWGLTTSAGPLTADVLVLGNGPLAEPAVPDLPGLETFAGRRLHSARWPARLDLRGARVGVVGTGASAIQLVPQIQPQVAHLSVFQRTPPWILPHRNRRIRGVERAIYRRVPAAQRLMREALYWAFELRGTGFVGSSSILHHAERLALRHLAKQVPDPELRAALTPDYRMGCKRIVPSDDYYPALVRSNVDLVTDRITEVRPHAVVTADGVEHPVDTLVFATGFHVTDNPIAERVHGARGASLAEAWEPEGMRAYLGITVPGFPNLFLLAGPNTGVGHTSLLVMVEAQIAYLTDALRTMERTGAAAIALRPEVLRAWTEEMARKSARTVWTSGGCGSWYLDAEGRNTTLWPDLTYRYRRRARRFDPAAYELTAPAEAPAGAEAGAGC